VAVAVVETVVAEVAVAATIDAVAAEAVEEMTVVVGTKQTF
jgi:hypothetical protein